MNLGCSRKKIQKKKKYSEKKMYRESVRYEASRGQIHV